MITFFLNQKGHSVLFDIEAGDFDFCEKCVKTRREELARAEQLFEHNGPLRGLELFSGKYELRDIILNCLLFY